MFEKNIELFKFNNNLINPCLTNVSTLFESISNVYADKIAIACNNFQISYQNLNNTANYYAIKLIHLGCKKGDIIGILLERDIPLIVLMLAVLKIGGIFLLISPTLPTERIKFILRHCNPFMLVSDAITHKIISTLQYKKIVFNLTDWSVISEKFDNLSLDVKGDDLAYLVYTSGTTGFPKGVLIKHQSLINTLLNQIELLNLSYLDKILSTFPVSFDGFIGEILGSLLSGSTVFLANSVERKSVKAISYFLEKYKTTMITLTPSMIRLFSKNHLQHLKILLSAGEACTNDLLNNLSDDCLFYNGYGLTETSICSTINLCKRNNNLMPIGKDIKNSFSYVLDENLNTVSVGQYGTLYIAGLGLFHSYLNDLERTKNKLITNPFSQSINKKILFNTGDIVKFINGNTFEYVGRNDDNFKVNGNLVNLSEIRVLLSKYPKVKNFSVNVVSDYKTKRNKIIVNVEITDNSTTQKDLRSYLSKYLPSYMLPHKILNNRSFELTNELEVVKY